MNLSEMFTEISGRTGLTATDTTDQTTMRNALNVAQREILGKANFWFALKVPTTAIITTTTARALYLLPYDFHKGLYLRQTNSDVYMEEETPTKFYEENPDPSATGYPDTFILNQLLWVANQPTAASVISFVSSAAGDITQTVVVRGIAGGVDVVEEVTLTGAVAAPTTNSFTYLYSITKSAVTVGTITATSNAGAVTNISLLPRELVKEYWEVRLHPIPNGAYSIYGGYYRRAWELYYNADVPLIPDTYIEALLSRATAKILFEQGDQQYAIWQQKAGSELIELMDANDWISQDKDERLEIKL